MRIRVVSGIHLEFRNSLPPVASVRLSCFVPGAARTDSMPCRSLVAG